MARAAIDFASIGLRCWTGAMVAMPRAHRHDEIELNLLVRGAIHYLHGGRRVVVRAGELGALWGAVPHQATAHDPDTQCHWLTVPLGWFLARNPPSRLVQTLLDGRLALDRGGDLAVDVAQFKRWQVDLASADKEARAIVLLELEARLRRLATRMSEPRAAGDAGAAPAAVERMAAFIAQRCADDIDVRAIAATADLHPKYATTVFRRAMGVALHDYLIRQRLARAQMLLATSDDTVLEIALASGFGSLSRFHAAFQAHLETTPARWRSALRRG